jgi:hypothetical protein
VRENAIEEGWKRFLDRLKELWGKLGGGDLPKTSVNAALACDRR